jgi:hypothetical protein
MLPNSTKSKRHRYCRLSLLTWVCSPITNPIVGRRGTSQSRSLLDDLVDLLQGFHQLLVVVAADLVAGDEVAVDVVQLRVPLTHVLPVDRSNSEM